MQDYLAGILVLISVLILLGGDLFIVMRWGYKYSVSSFMHWLAGAFPIVLLLTGIVLGHFWWPIQVDASNPAYICQPK